MPEFRQVGKIEIGVMQGEAQAEWTSDTVRISIKDRMDQVLWEFRGPDNETDAADKTLEDYQHLVGMKICTNKQTLVKIQFVIFDE